MKTVSVPVIKTNEDHEEALARVEARMRFEGQVADEVRILSLVIREYEADTVRFREPDPVEVLQFVLNERELEPVVLVPFIGSLSQVVDVLDRHLPLTAEMIRKLSAGLGIPAGVLIGSVDQTAAA